MLRGLSEQEVPDASTLFNITQRLAAGLVSSFALRNVARPAG